MTDLNRYAEELLQAKGVTNVGQADYEDIKLDLIDQIDEEIDNIIRDQLPDEAKEAFERLMDKDDEETLTGFLAAYIPDLDLLVDEVLREFRKSYLA